MKLLRNPEIRKAVFVYGILAAAAATAAFFLDARFGFFTVALCAVFLFLYLFSTYRRYRYIAELSADIDRILHGEEQMDLTGYDEGELSVLQSEIYKMTVRLREQRQNLRNDKLFLADSLADISHQLRTPLTSINLLVSLLAKPDITDARRQEISRELYELLSRVDWLITALLKMSRLDAAAVTFHPASVPLETLLQKAAEPLLIPMELRDQTLRVTAAGVCSCDIGWTCEAVTNIIKNCMEHTPNGGSLELYGSDNSLYTEIVISDNGSGIPKADLPHIFERFYKGKNSDSKSFGIGLALARTIITAQNGTIKAENRKPRGALFTVRFYKSVV